MCEFKIWLKTKLDGSDCSYWCNRIAQAYYDGEEYALITILEDYEDGLIYLSPSDFIILKANLDEIERDVAK